jgi:hypothetical protein
MTVNPTWGAQTVPEYLQDADMHRRILARAINSLTRGKMNITLDVILTAGAVSTTISDNRIGYDSAIIPAMPMTASGAAALSAGIYVDGVTAPVGTTLATAQIHHANSANTDQTIRFLIIG